MIEEQEEEARYRGIFESTSEGIGIVDREGILVEANPAFFRMFGMAEQEMMGKRSTRAKRPPGCYSF